MPFVLRPYCCRALEAGKKDPILKPYVLKDEVEKLAKEKKQPELNDSGFARLLKVSPNQLDIITIDEQIFLVCHVSLRHS